jgi:pilus assembly protein Flp/PilA
MQYPITKFRKFLANRLGDQSGATAIEYGLIAALIAVAAIAAMQGLGDSLKTTFNSTSSSMATSSA